VSEHDPFGTADLRAAVLAAWQASPTRFREDANTEEDLALGAYRDRVVVELAQNAADAAARAGVRADEGGRLLLRLTGGPAPRLVAANTGAPLDADGVRALASLRASAKQDGATVGRFGVGFAAVLGVSDEPAVGGPAGGVRFSREETLAAVRAVGDRGLTEELERRGGHVPVLRLPWPSPALEPPDGYDTVVVVPLRDDAAVAAVHAQLAALGDGLLLALPALGEVTVELPGEPARVLRDVGARWRVLRREGRFTPDLLADRPTEDRARTAWSVTWAVPRGVPLHPADAVVHAPTPSEEPLAWPALLVGTFPLDPSRRHVAAGPATDALVAHAAAAYADLLAALAADPDAEPVWPLVPTGLPAGVLDGALRAALAPLLPATPFLRAAEDPAVVLRPRDAVALEPPAGADAAAVGALAPVVAGLVLAPRSATAAFALAGVRRVALADVVDQLPAPATEDAWRSLYRGLEPLAADAATREALAALPVPLADGRVVRGARDVVLPGGGPDDGVAAALAVLGARAVHVGVGADEACRRLLERLGARAVPAAEALALPAVVAAVRDLAAVGSQDEPDEEARVDAVLTLVRQAVSSGEPRLPAELAGLPLPDADGEVAPASALALPGSPAARLLDEREVGLVDPDLIERWGADVLRAVGVLDTLAVLRAADVPLDAPPDDELDEALDGVGDWLAVTAARAAAHWGSALAVVVAELVAVRDLDLVRDDAWEQVLALLAGDRTLRAALLTPARLAGPAGGVLEVPSYTAWWLRERFAGGGAWADPAASEPVRALLPPAPPEPADADPAVRAALGGVRDLGQLDAEGVHDLLDALADPDVVVDAAAALRAWAVLADLVGAAGDVEPPDQVRVLEGDGTVVVDAADAVVVGDPLHAQRTDLGGLVVAPDPARAEALARLLDLPLAGDLADGVVDETGARPADVPPEVAAVLPSAPGRWCEHEELRVDGADVDWWVDDAGLVHATTVDALARGLAAAAGDWGARAAVAEVLLDPEALGAVLLDRAFEERAFSAAGGPRA
jgi:hypothetical protein